MKLEDSEIKELKAGGPVKVWRFGDEPASSEPMHRYSSGGNEYTVIARREITADEILRTQSRLTYRTVREAVEANGGKAWLVVIVKGDRTDRPRLLQPSGRKSGDYTSDPHRAMEGEPEAISAEEADEMAKQSQAARERRTQNVGDRGLEEIEEELARPGLRREERRDLRHARFALKKLGGRSK